jgi:hypothetical protein
MKNEAKRSDLEHCRFHTFTVEFERAKVKETVIQSHQIPSSQASANCPTKIIRSNQSNPM